MTRSADQPSLKPSLGAWSKVPGPAGPSADAIRATLRVRGQAALVSVWKRVSVVAGLVGAAALPVVSAVAQNTPGSGNSNADPGPSSTGGAEVATPPSSGDPIWDALVYWSDRIWNLKLFTAGDTDIHINQLVIACLVLVLGLFVAKRIARLTFLRVSKLKRIEGSVAYVVQKLVYYALILVSVFIALPVAGIPITIFALLGGALAIGVGFGAQNLCNNLISGFILLIERPIRLMDAVEIDGTTGNVQEIGSRSTRIRRGDGVDVLVPNSHFLENAIVNWTLKDNAVRGCVEVGIAYGSDTALFKELFLQAMRENDAVHPSPAPEVLFESFGDNALGFNGYFWLNAFKPMDRKRVESAVRFRVDELCRQHDVTIAFPQRDVHLDTLSPLEVRMVGGGGNGGAAAGQSANG